MLVSTLGRRVRASVLQLPVGSCAVHLPFASDVVQLSWTAQSPSLPPCPFLLALLRHTCVLVASLFHSSTFFAGALQRKLAN